MVNLRQDVRYGMRMLFKKPGFTAAAVLVLALGVGANTAVFSLVNAFLLKPLNIHNPEELLGCYSRDSQKPDSYRPFSYPNYVDIREKSTVFSSLVAHNMALIGLGDGAATRRVFADVVSSNYFHTFGVRLASGRTFTAAEETPGNAAPVTIIGYSLWKRSGSDPGILGTRLRINGTLFTVVGVAPEGFTGTTAIVSPDLYLPLGMYSSVMNDFQGRAHPLSARDNHALILFGRLRPGMTARQADGQLAVVAAQLEKAYPAENRNQTFFVHPLSRLSITTNPSDENALIAPAVMLLSMAAVVLLIASLNLANMMLARGTARRKEIAIRLAIGGGRGRIVRQLFTEGLLLSVLGGAAGLFVSSWSTSLLISSMARVAPIDFVYNSEPDARVLAATLGFCMLSTVLFALWPAWKLSSPDVVSDLKKNIGEDSTGGSRRLFSRRNLVVMGQLALSLMMLTAAGLFVRSALRASQVSPGFALDNGLLAEIDPSMAGYDEARGRALSATVIQRLRNVPGVESVSLAATVPFGMISLGQHLRRFEKETAVAASFNMISADYFKTLGIPLLRGRAFSDSEIATGSQRKVAIIDKLAANRLWGKGEAIGQHILLDSDEPGKPPENVEVVGIVGTVQERILGQGLEPHLYIPLGQRYQADLQIHLKVAVKGREAQAKVLEAVRTELHNIDPLLPVLALKTLRDHLEASLDLWVVATGARILGIFGAVALLLAVIGLYGVKAYTVAMRTREIGIRMALGANPADNLKMILKEGFAVTLVGIGAGLLLALAVGKVLSGMLYEVGAIDPLVLLAAPVVLMTASLMATYLPARRASLVDPMVALRDE